MCLAVPVLIRKVEGMMAEVEIGGVTRTISLALTPDAKINDYVLVHAGYAIGTLDEEEAKESLKLLEQMAAFYGADESERGSR